MIGGLAEVLAVLTVGSVTVLPPNATALDLSAALKSLDEAPLEAWSDQARSFRFIWLPPFPSQRVISVRIQDTAKGALLSAKAVALSGGVVARAERRLSTAEWDELVEARQDGFWKFHPQEYPQPFFDGATWILEGAASGERLRIVQHVPSPGAFVDLCRRMFLLSGVRLHDSESSLVAR